MKLYSYYRSSSAWRVRLVLSWKKVNYEYVAVNLAPSANEQASPAFARVNPLRQVPTLEWSEGGVTTRLTQSVAIAELLEESHPEAPLLPTDRLARARVREAVEVVSSGTQPLQNSAVLEQIARLAGDAERLAWARNAITTGLTALEALTRAHPGRHLVGDTVSLADVFLVPQLYNARRFGIDLSPFEKLLDAEALVAELPAFRAAHPDQQPDSPRPASGSIGGAP